MKQPHAQVLFHPTHALADAGGRNTQNTPGSHKAARFGRLNENIERKAIHGSTCFAETSYTLCGLLPQLIETWKDSISVFRSLKGGQSACKSRLNPGEIIWST